MAWDNSFFRMPNMFSPESRDSEAATSQVSPRVMRQFGTVFNPTSTYGQMDEDPETIFMRRFRQMTDINGPAQDSYRNFISTGMPDRSDYEPTKMRKFLAALGGGAAGYRNPERGIRLAEDIRDDPYNKAVQDFQFKAKNLENAAQEERQSLSARRQILNDTLRDQYNQGRLGETRFANETKREQNPSIIAKNEAQAGAADAHAGYDKARTTEIPKDSKAKRALQTATTGLIDAKTDVVGKDAESRRIAANAATTRAEKTGSKTAKTQPVYETYHTVQDESAAKSQAVKNVIQKNTTYSQFGEKDKAGGLTGNIIPYKPGFIFDDTAKYNEFQREVQREQKRILDANPRKRRTSAGKSTMTVKEVMDSFDQ